MASPDNLPPWTVLLTDAVWKVRTLKDMGIHPIRIYVLVGKCSRHGEVRYRLETLDGEPAEGDQIQCLNHLYELATIHWVRVTHWSEESAGDK